MAETGEAGGGGGAERAGGGKEGKDVTNGNVGDRKRKSDDDVVGEGEPVELGKRGKDRGVEDKVRDGGEGGGRRGGGGAGERGGDGGGRMGGSKRRIREATPDKVGQLKIIAIMKLSGSLASNKHI